MKLIKAIKSFMIQTPGRKKKKNSRTSGECNKCREWKLKKGLSLIGWW
jgi:hypothetical protein